MGETIFKMEHNGLTFSYVNQDEVIDIKSEFSDNFFLITTENKDLQFEKEDFKIEEVEKYLSGEKPSKLFDNYHFIPIYGYRSPQEIWLSISAIHSWIGYVVVEKPNISYEEEVYFAKRYVDFLQNYYQNSLFTIIVTDVEDNVVDLIGGVTEHTILSDFDVLDIDEESIKVFKKGLLSKFYRINPALYE